MAISAAAVRELERNANRIRRDVVEMIGVGMAGHLGGSCSLADIISVLYFHTMHHDPKNPKLPERDRLILSKGHAAIVQYAALAECGYFDKALLKTLKNFGSPLQGHPDLRKLTGLEANTGSLGQGVSIAAGMAAALKLDQNPARVFVATGDGELDNLRVIVDKNGLQATGKTKDRFPIENIGGRLEAFGFAVQEIDGHNISEIVEAFEKADTVKGKPSAIIAHTIKGKGIPFAENVASFHNGTLTQELYDEALEVLAKREEALL